MPAEPAIKRACAFVDGQNLYHAAKDAFGYHFPNYDFPKLAEAVCISRKWNLSSTRFYTGVPKPMDNAHWSFFWNRKLQVMGTRGVVTYSRPLQQLTQKEKGIDVRIALDIVRLARKREYDVAVVFSQDQDLSEAADEVRAISLEQNRWIRIVAAFPVSLTAPNCRGINGAHEWVKIDRAMYDTCIDPLDHRPPRTQMGLPGLTP